MAETLARGAGALYLVSLLAFPLALASNIVAGNFLHPEDYGLFATANFIVGLVSMVSSASLATVLIRQPSALETRDYSSVFLYQLASGVFLAGILAVAADPIGRFYSTNAEDPVRYAGELASMIRWLAVLPILQPFVTVPMVRIERELRYVKLAALSAIWGVAERIITIVLMVELLRGHSYVYARLGGAVIQAALLFGVARWNPVELVAEAARRGWAGRAHIRFGLLLQLKTFSDTIISALIPGLGAKIFHPDLVGLMAWSHNVAFMVGQPLPQSVGRVVVGASHRFERGGKELVAFTEGALFACTAVVGLALSILAATMPEILLYLFKPRWYEAGPYFAMMCLVMAASILHVFYDAAMVIVGRPVATGVANWARAAVSVGACLGFGHVFGPVGFMGGYAIGALVPLAILHPIARREFPMRTARHFWLPLLGSALAGLAAYLLKDLVVRGLWSLIAFDCALFGLGLAAFVALDRRILEVIRYTTRRRTPSTTE